jgi:hypothetical protein
VEKLVLGDRVEVIRHSEPKHIGERGTVIHVGTGIKPTTGAIVGKHPKKETEPRYNMALDDGGDLRDLREQQMRKLEGTTHQQEK